MAWFHCQFCDYLRELSDEHVGKPAKCPSCKKRGTVVAAREDGLQTIGRLVEGGDDEPPEPSLREDRGAGNFGNGLVEPPNAAGSEEGGAKETDGEIDDWQNDSFESPTPSTPQSQQNKGNPAHVSSTLQSIYERTANWSSKGSTGRVFENYVTVRYLRWAWKVAIAVVGVVWLIGVLVIGFEGLDLIFVSTAHDTAKSSDVAFFVVAGFKIVALVIVLGLFTLTCLLELFLARMGLETVAVFFDIAHDIRRLADVSSSSEPTSNAG